MTNAEIARVLQGEARLLAGRASALYRVRAYRQAAAWIAMYPRDLESVYAQEGKAGLEKIPGVGSHLAYTLEVLLTTGEIRSVRNANAEVEPQRQTASLPGIGHLTAARLRDEGGIETVDELAVAIENELPIPGLSPGRLATLRQVLRERAAETAPPRGEPDIEDLLIVDAIFRDQDSPTLTWARAGFRYRVELDQSALAFRLDRVGDRVVVRFTDGVQNGERLIETERHGELTGQRVIRGREVECRRLATQLASA